MLALISAMPEEIAQVLASLEDVTRREGGGRTFHCGSFHGVPVVAAFSRWGKVAAAATVAQLLSLWQISQLVFCGVAGAVRADLAIGDIIVGTALIQHDMDASPLFPRYEVPLHGRAEFAADPGLAGRLLAAARIFVREDLATAVDAQERRFFGIREPAVHAGLIASGDRFFAGGAALAELRARLPRTLCVEMEGAAAAQVCAEHGVPFAVVRTISDGGDEHAPRDFPRFTRTIARQFGAGILGRFVRGPQAAP